VSPLITAVLIALATLTVWGFVAPRGQWRVLAGWSRRDATGSEPGPVAVAIHRGVSGVALVVAVFGGFSLTTPTHENVVRAANVPAKMGAVERLWGAPSPVVVNRVSVALGAPPAGLVAQPVLRYQAVDGVQRSPSYLFSLKDYSRPNPKPQDGYIGTPPPAGLTALDTAGLVVQVRADPRCIPYQVAVVETDSSVTVGVYFGRPNPGGSGNAAIIAQCETSPTPAKSVSMLIPIVLQDPVLKRAVKSFDGSPIDVAGVPAN
jgi:hypothetical protein